MKNSNKSHSTTKKVFNKAGLVLLMIIGFLLQLFLILFSTIYIVLETERAQLYLTGHIEDYLVKKTGTNVEVKHVFISFPKDIGVKDLYIEDKEGNTLVNLGKVKVNLRFYSLLNKKIDIRSITIDNLEGRIKRHKEAESFNYQFLVESFSSTNGKEKEKQEDTQPWTFDIKRLDFNHVDIEYHDFAGGAIIDVSFNSFNLSINKFSFEKEGTFDLDRISLYDADIYVDISAMTPSPSDPATETSIPAISLASLDLGKLDFRMKGNRGMSVHADLDDLQLTPGHIDLNNMDFNIKMLTMNGGLVNYDPPKDPNDTIAREYKINDTPTVISNSNNNGLKISAGNISLNNLDILYNDSIPIPGFYNGINLQKVNCQLSNTYFSMDSVHLNASHISMYQHDGINIKELNGIVSIGRKLSVQNLELLTGESSLKADMKAGLNLLKPAGITKQDPVLEINKLDGVIGKDITTFFPFIKDYYFTKPADQPVKFGLKAHGSLNNMAIDTLWITAVNYFTCHLGGNAENILSQDIFNIKVDTFAIMTAPNTLIASARNIPSIQNISMPDYLFINGKGSFAGDSLSYDIKGLSNKGLFESNGHLSGLVKNDSMKLSGGLNFTDIDLGYILNNDTLLGKTTGAITTRGTWKNLENADIDFDIAIENVNLNNYIYKGFNTTGHFKDKTISLDMFYKDEYLDFDLKTYIALFENTEVSVSGNITSIVFKQLNLLEDDLRLTMNIDSDILLFDNNWAEGNITLYDTRIYKDLDLYIVDTLEALSWSEGNIKNINIKSGFLDASFKGNINPIETPELLLAHLHDHILRNQEMKNNDTVSTQGKKFELSATLTPSALITDVIYEKVGEYHSITLESYFDGDESELSVDLFSQYLVHEAITLNNINLSLLSGNNTLDFHTKFDEMNFNGQVYKNFALEGIMESNTLGFNLSFDDTFEKQIFNLNGNIDRQEQVWAFSILPANLVINYDKWQIEKDNKIIFGNNGIITENFILAFDEQSVTLKTVRDGENPPTLKAGFDNFKLNNISGIIQEPGFVEGTLNGNVDLIDFAGDMQLSANILLQNFSFRENKIGNIDFKAHSTAENDYHVFANIEGYDNEMEISGIYSTSSESPFDFEVNFPNIEIKSIEGFVYGELSEMTGSAEGRFSLKGSPQNPDLKGYVTFKEASFVVNYLNTNILIDDETFYLDNNQITFDNFRFTDAGERFSTIDGVIVLRSIYDIGYDLNIISQNFEYVNIPRGQNNLFYGKLIIDSDLNIRGDLGNPVISGNLKLNQGSAFSYIVPQTSPELIGREGVVEFWVPADTLLFTRADTIITQTAQTVPFTNIDMSLNVDIDRAADLRIIMDEAAGDYLEVKGGGVISLGINPAGEITLAGRYELVEGTYQLTFYDFIRKRFSIRSGSNLVWTGNPLKAQLDVTAVYNTRAPVRDLLESRVTAGQDIEPRMLNQLLPFNVLLNMKGDLEQPQISFQIDMPVEHRNALNGLVYNKIQELNQNESDLNKQVFSLLMFDKFMPDNLLALLGPSNGGSAAARTSASRIMTQQLNRLSDRYIRNVEITFDIESYEDYASSDLTGRTELQLELTKDFFDERVIVTVGGNIEIEDPERRETDPGDFAGDVSVEYLLLDDGSLRLKGYRKNEFADVFEGQITETGLSLIFMRNFNEFSEMFRRRENKETLEED